MIDLSTDKKEIATMEYEAGYEAVQHEIRLLLSSAPLIIRQYTQHLLGAQGKHIRALALLSCSMNGQNLVSENAVKLAAATEILHLATLVHDDVIDNADMRRGIPSLQKKFGKKTAVICGDYLFSVALKLAGSVANKQDYADFQVPDYVSQICFGELSQLIHNGDLNLSELEYFKIISGKTAALFEACFYAGAVLSGCDDIEAKKYKRLGWYTGMIFQIKDDCDDFESTREIAKKTVQSDYEQNVITLPLIYALKRSDDLKQRIKAGKVNRQELNRAVAECEGLAYAHAAAQKFYDKSFQIVSEVQMTDKKRTNILGILNKSMKL